MTETLEVDALAAEIDAAIRALPERNTPAVRTVLRRYTRALKEAEPALMLGLTETLVRRYGYRGTAYELLQAHRAAFATLDTAQIEALGEGIDSWWAVDAFARLVSGPAWLQGLLADATIHRWAQSGDLWWRRAALVSTVALNMRSQGGPGDAARTLTVCEILAGDHEDMVVKALSWALRALAVRDPDAVRRFLADHDAVLAARVKREVRSKLQTGLKNPRARGR